MSATVHPTVAANPVAATVAAVLVLQELDRLRSVECLPTPELLLERLRFRAADFHLATGTTLAYLREVDPSSLFPGRA